MEANFDGLVGQSHVFGGLSHGNRASTTHEGAVSRPKESALQGLRKMKLLSDHGVPQGLLLPHPRPCFGALRALGFEGTEPHMIQTAYATAPRLLAQVYSAAPMWVANAATVSPSADTGDAKVHLTPANLATKFHRSLEPETTGRILRAVFSGPCFAHHAPLPSHPTFGDEGAANFMRLGRSHLERGVEVFVYGHKSLSPSALPSRFPSRQSMEASQAVARAHKLDPAHVRFVQQNPDVIDQGVFHNDVIAVANGPLLFAHQDAFLDQDAHLAWFRDHVDGFEALIVDRDEVSVEDAVRSYLFNSQLVTLSHGRVLLVAAQECRETDSVRDYLGRVVGRTAIDAVEFVDLRESMKNGGGPACLRLRVVLTPQERAAVAPGVWVNDDTYPNFVAWVQKHYRDELGPSDLGDPALFYEIRTALDELTQITGLGSIYAFQQA